jgi:hypothetical protein
METRRSTGGRVAWVSVALSLVVAACGSDRSIVPTGPTASGDVVIESTVLEQQHISVGTTETPFGCDVLGRARNDSPRDLIVTIRFQAFNRSEQVIATGSSGRTPVPAGGRSSFRAPLTFITECGAVNRLEVAEIRAEPA